jgi:hypothetical protein
MAMADSRGVEDKTNTWRHDEDDTRRSRARPPADVPSHSRWIRLAAAALLLFTPKGKTQVINAGFEASTPDQSWQVEPEEAKQSYTITADKKDLKEGRQSLQISAEKPVILTLRQQLFLPIGTLWRLTGWVKSSFSCAAIRWGCPRKKPGPGPREGLITTGGL